MKKKPIEYSQQATTLTIQATSRISVKIKETFYTFEFTEQRGVPAVGYVDLEKEREYLWNKVHNEVDKQVEEVVKITQGGR